jgi:hypothetical protein
MSDLNMSEKIITNVVEGISNIMKRNNIFDKTDKISYLLTGLIISSSIFGLFTIYNTHKCDMIQDDISYTNKFIKKTEHFPKVYYQILLDTNSTIYDINQNYILIIKQIKNYNEKMEKIEEMEKNINKVIALLEDKKE